MTSNRYNPGVGNYNLGENAGKNSAKFSFGKEPRSQSARPNTPGPGTYQQKNFIGNDGPKISISNVRPLSSSGSSSNLLPGPGAYQTNLNDKKTAPKYGFGSAKRINENKEAILVPGAGAYTPLNVSMSNRPKSPTWSIGKGMRGNKSLTEYVPGPGNYEFKNSIGGGPMVI